MIRIIELTLENFAPILSGTGKERIHIDLSGSNKLINVLIGRIGSGKTYILSHLQPFATVGTMDIRNSDDPIIPGKDGYKEIIYDLDGAIYRIQHKYIQSSNGSHSKKSYVEKDGIELNPNGNQSSFNDIIQLEFGIDQSFMRLMRLGPNVVNFINMKATERKAYIASLLKDTNMYLILYKHWSAELRNINAKVSVLMNKLSTFGKETVPELNEIMWDYEDQQSELQTQIDDYKQKQMNIHAESNALLEGKSLEEALKSIESERHSYDLNNQILDNDKSRLESLNEDKRDVTSVSRDIGKYDSLLGIATHKLLDLEKEYDQCVMTLNNLKDKQAISENKTHMQTLRENYESLRRKALQYEEELKGFTCKYSSMYLEGILEELNIFNSMIAELGQYDKESFIKIYHSDSSVIKWAKDKIDILNGRRRNVHREISNIKFAATYVPPELLYRPPFCPTKKCPYFRTHPSTIQRSLPSQERLNAEVVQYQEELQKLDVEISRYEEYPTIYAKLSSIREYWKRFYPVLKEIHAATESDLEKVILHSGYRTWYNYDHIVDTIALVKKKGRFAELTEEIKTIKTQLNQLELSRDEDMEKEIKRMEEQKKALAASIEDTEKAITENKNKLVSLNSFYEAVSKKDDLERRIRDHEHDLRKQKSEIYDLEKACEKVRDNKILDEKLSRDIFELSGRLSDLMKKMDSLRLKINDVTYTRKELDQLLQEQKWMSYMVDAVGSKKGIPMVMVKLFFESCRNTINDMLSLVTEDDFFLEEFEIGENEFLIPYSVNGNVADDISKASQGQSSLASEAMSFAIVKELSSVIYTIPLLDEMDAPLHKNDKKKSLAITFQYLKDIGSTQCFIITHDENLFDGYPVQVIMTTDESVNNDRYPDAIHI